MGKHAEEGDEVEGLPADRDTGHVINMEPEVGSLEVPRAERNRLRPDVGADITPAVGQDINQSRAELAGAAADIQHPGVRGETDVS